MKKNITRTTITCFLLATLLLLSGCGGKSLFAKEGEFRTKAALYEAIVECMEKNQSKLTFTYTGFNSDKAVDVATIIQTIPGIESIEYSVSSSLLGSKYEFNMKYWDSDAIIYAYRNLDSSHLTDRQQTMYDKYISIINTYTSASNSIFENEQAIYNYLVDNITYDINVQSHFNAYEALIEGRAVCAGYAECFRTLMELLGYECTAITGVADNENHMWNAIRIDNEWYQVDVTWGDSNEQETNPVRVYAYFNIPEQEMALTHTRESILPDNYVDGLRYTYVNYKSVPTLYNQADLNRYIHDSMASRASTIEFMTKEPLNAQTAVSLANINCSYALKSIEKGSLYYYFINCTYY